MVLPDEYFMKQALYEAKKGQNKKEIPVGAVIVLSNYRIIAKAYNQNMCLNDPTAHAEMIAITEACNYLNSRYLNQCTLYTTLEPCPMCAGAIFWAQIERVVFSTFDNLRGYSKFSQNIIPKYIPVSSGILAHESEFLLKDFFSKNEKMTIFVFLIFHY